eukprot:16443024-Heterocapsa_arctica.AAC.1
MGIGKPMLLKLRIGLPSSDFVQSDKRSARNLMVIARMHEDHSTTSKNPQRHRHLYVYTCRAH